MKKHKNDVVIIPVISMANIDKVISGIRHCMTDKSHVKQCTGCAYRYSDFYEHSLGTDMLELLKAQKPIAPDIDSEGTCSCGNCGITVGYYPVGSSVPNKGCKYCPECGRKVEWK